MYEQETHSQILQLGVQRRSGWALSFQPSEWFISVQRRQIHWWSSLKAISHIYPASFLYLISFPLPVPLCCVLCLGYIFQLCPFLPFSLLSSYRVGPGVCASVYPQCHSSGISSRCDAVPPGSGWRRGSKQHPFYLHNPCCLLFLLLLSLLHRLW